MPTIHLETLIAAPIDRCFDLMRDVDAHIRSTAGTQALSRARPAAYSPTATKLPAISGKLQDERCSWIPSIVATAPRGSNPVRARESAKVSAAQYLPGAT